MIVYNIYINILMLKLLLKFIKNKLCLNIIILDF